MSTTEAPTESLVITAMACRFPNASSPAELWEAVKNREEHLTSWPLDRPVPNGLDPQDFKGGFLTDAATFDAARFGISPREAVAMDPQQRLLLEVASQTFEVAGLDRDELKDRNVGVYIGAMSQEYGPGLASRDSSALGYGITGSAVSVISGRISYYFGLRGPTLTVETACSSSLSALHLALQSLRRGECEMALVGGVCVMPTPALFIDFARQGGLDSGGKCRTFSAEADGTCWSEGAGMILLEPEATARAHGRSVLARVLGSAINHDGSSNGLTAPSRKAQEDVISRALNDAGVHPSQVDLVEAHGTGTPLGDAIELAALQRSYGRHHTSQDPLYIGSLKSNVGHMQAASGIGGLIKSVQAIRNKTMPATLNAAPLSEDFAWENSGISVLQQERLWESRYPGIGRIAAVSAFGISGTNAHVIIGEGDEIGELPTREPRNQMVALRVDGSSGEALHERCHQIINYLDTNGDLNRVAEDLAARPRRSSARHLVVSDLDQARRALSSADPRRLESPGQEPFNCPPHWVEQFDGADAPVFVFAGQGSQWPGMGRELMSQPVFADHMRACQEQFNKYGSWDLIEALNQDRLSVDIVQPCLFAVMTSMAALWRSRGFEPSAVIGHSQGEISAAYVAGALTLSDAAMIVSLRSKTILEEAPAGGMLLLRARHDEAQRLLDEANLPLTVAAINGPKTCVVAGDVPHLQELLPLAEGAEMRPRLVDVDYASHTPAVERLSDTLTSRLSDISSARPRVPFYSTLHGRVLEGDESLDAAYWVANLLKPVNFLASVSRCIEDGRKTFIECTPHPTLLSVIEETAEDMGVDIVAVGSVRRDSGGYGEFLASSCRVDQARPRPRAFTNAPDLPPAPYEGERFWLPPTPATGARNQNSGGSGTLVAEALNLATGVCVANLTTGSEADSHRWLRDHLVNGQPVIPATAMLEALIEVIPDGHTLDEVTLTRTLTPGDKLSITASPDMDLCYGVEVHRRGRGSAGFDRVMTARSSTSNRGLVMQYLEWGSSKGETILPKDLYSALENRGYGYHDSFRCVTESWRDGNVYYSLISRKGETGSSAPMLDACLHSALLAWSSLAVPFVWRGVRLNLNQPPEVLRVRCEITGHMTARLLAEDTDGRHIFSVDEVVFRSMGHPAVQPLRSISWKRIPDPNRSGKIEANAPVVGLLADAAQRVRALLSTHDEVWIRAEDEEVWDTETLVDRCTAAAESVQACLATPSGRLVFLVNSATITPSDNKLRIVSASVAALARSCAREHPDRVYVLDTDTTDPMNVSSALSLAAEGHEVAVRGGKYYGREIVSVRNDELAPPSEGPWRLDVTRRGTLDDLTLMQWPQALRPLGPDEVRVAVHVGGLNFRDIAVGLNLVPTETTMGSEGAGVITEVGSEVEKLAIGDRVFGVFSESLATHAVANVSQLEKLPDAWSFAQGAAIPITGITAYQCLVDEAHVRPGESVLVHTATGGVGLAAIQLARHFGCEVFATASPSKHSLLLEMGIPESHIASSRNLGFAEKFRDASDGRGLDVVLNSLSGPATDASLRLLAPGGRFVEMGKTDIRDPKTVSLDYPHIRYSAYNILGVAPMRIGEVLRTLTPLYDKGTINWPPIHNTDVRAASHALHQLRHAKHLGKLTASLPPIIDTGRPCLITGGTSGLGAVVANHLLATRQIKDFVLISRSGISATGAPEIVTDLRQNGARVVVEVCDVADARKVKGIVEKHNPSLIIHAAGALHDKPAKNLRASDFEEVLRPKLSGLVNLYEATRIAAKSTIVCFSSIAGTIGTAGQANYAAANAAMDHFVDISCSSEAAQMKSIAWGLWEVPTPMTAHLSDLDRRRLERSSKIGSIPTASALQLFDAALESAEPCTIAANLLPARNTTQRGATVEGTPGNTETLSAICAQTAEVLGAEPNSVKPTSEFKQLGFDSLLSVDLRNKLNKELGLKLRAEVVLDHRSPIELARYIEQLEGCKER